MVVDADRPTLYLDFDGTLHAGSALIDEAGRISLDSGRELFEYAPLLAKRVESYPDVQIVLTTEWLRTLGRDGAASYLPESLRARVVGDTLAVSRRLSEIRNGSERTSIILRHAWRQSVKAWLALDDAAWGVPAEFEHHFVHLDPTKGIGAEDALARIDSWLRGQTRAA